jgi:hypothetical protein
LRCTLVRPPSCARPVECERVSSLSKSGSGNLFEPVVLLVENDPQGAQADQALRRCVSLRREDVALGTQGAIALLRRPAIVSGRRRLHFKRRNDPAEHCRRLNRRGMPTAAGRAGGKRYRQAGCNVALAVTYRDVAFSSLCLSPACGTFSCPLRTRNAYWAATILTAPAFRRGFSLGASRRPRSAAASSSSPPFLS